MAYATKQSVALDYGRFDQQKREKTQNVKALPENKNVHRRAPEIIPYVKYGMIFACVFAVLMIIVASYMQVTELTSQNAVLRKNIEKLKSEENALNAKKEERFNLSYVEEQAKNMGMVKQDKAATQYIELSNGERSTIAAQNDNTAPAVISGIVKSFNAVVEYLK